MIQPTLFPESGFFRARITLAYDGTDFFGWARQRDQRTVQGELESALQTLYQRDLETVVAGRTDAGVHAINQVCHVDLPELEYENLAYRLNRILTEEIRVKSVDRAPYGFHARFGALRRHYIYKILDDNQIIDPLQRFDIAPWYRKLDVAKMNLAAQTLLGEHDFHSFARFRENSTTVRTLERLEFERQNDGSIVGYVSADAFLYNMVRSIVGTLVYVGEGRFTAEWVRETLEKRERPSDSIVFPARGLTFVGVDYPSDEELVARATKTMNLRSEDE